MIDLWKGFIKNIEVLEILTDIHAAIELKFQPIISCLINTHLFSQMQKNDQFFSKKRWTEILFGSKINFSKIIGSIYAYKRQASNVLESNA